jgi:hypothetical protein
VEKINQDTSLQDDIERKAITPSYAAMQLSKTDFEMGW